MRALVVSVTCLGLACLGLAACSKEPSEEEMKALVEAHTRESLNKAGQPFHGFLAFRKQGCVESKTVADAYDCYYAATVPGAGPADPMAVNGKGRFRNTAKGLSFEDLGAQPR